MQRDDGSGGSAVFEKLQEIKGDMIKAGLKFNKRTHALFVEAHILDSNTEVSHVNLFCSSATIRPHFTAAGGSLFLWPSCSLPCWHLRTWQSWRGREL